MDIRQPSVTRDIPAAQMWGTLGALTRSRDISTCLAWTHPALITAGGVLGMPAAIAHPSSTFSPYLTRPDRHWFTASSQTFSQFKAVTKLHFTLKNYLYCNLASFVVKTSCATARTGILGVGVPCFCFLRKLTGIADENRGHWGGVISSTLPWQICHQLLCLTWGAAS